MRSRQLRNGLIANVTGALLVFAFAAFLFPVSPRYRDEVGDLAVRSGIVLAIYLPLALLLGVRWINGIARPVERWLIEGRPAADADRKRVLGLPWAQARAAATFWGIGAMLFTIVNASIGPRTLVNGVIATLGGLTTAALIYLLAERTYRPVTAIALEDAPATRITRPGVSRRLTIAWVLGTGVPVLGTAAVAVAALLDRGVQRGDVAWAVLFLAAVAGAAGLTVTLTTAGSVGEPLTALRHALSRVQRGDFEVRVPVDDGSEIGVLESGFNTMVAGLHDRERLREAFGSFVDPDLTERVLREGTDLAGEEVDVSVLFMDVRGFTSYAENASAHDVVAMLNELYGEVVPVVAGHGGHANKFIGDGLLAVFGAPGRLPDHATAAVEAAKTIAKRVSVRYGESLRIGIGINSGLVVAGTIGGGGRVDFTVIGDVVNTAARVESATRQTGDDILITAATLDLVADDAGQWQERPAVELKGKSRAVRLYAPRGA